MEIINVRKEMRLSRRLLPAPAVVASLLLVAATIGLADTETGDMKVANVTDTPTTTTTAETTTAMSKDSGEGQEVTLRTPTKTAETKESGRLLIPVAHWLGQDEDCKTSTSLWCVLEPFNTHSLSVGTDRWDVSLHKIGFFQFYKTFFFWLLNKIFGSVNSFGWGQDQGEQHHGGWGGGWGQHGQNHHQGWGWGQKLQGWSQQYHYTNGWGNNKH